MGAASRSAAYSFHVERLICSRARELGGHPPPHGAGAVQGKRWNRNVPRCRRTAVTRRGFLGGEQ